MDSNHPIKVLFLAADPSDATRLRLGQELQEIRQTLQHENVSDHLVLLESACLIWEEVSQSIRKYEPQIIHFSGHSEGVGELCFENEQQQIQSVPAAALVNLFQSGITSVEGVVFNTCHAKAQAKAIAPYVPFLVGTHREIGDSSAIAFASEFYRTLSHHLKIAQAYQSGYNKLRADGIPEEWIPVLYVQGKRDQSAQILTQVQSGNLWVVNSRKRNGLIICKRFHAEFAGPGAAVGSFFDANCEHVIPVGDFSVLATDDPEERHKAFMIRRQWIRLLQQFTDNSAPLQRAQMILNQFKQYFDQPTIAQVPDEVFALMVGVLPHTVNQARSGLL
jgi:hypothetical protein